jgi:hypothetical protein
MNRVVWPVDADEEEAFREVLMEYRWHYHPRNLHYRRPFWPRAKDFILKYVVWFLIDAVGVYLVLRLLGVV